MIESISYVDDTLIPKENEVEYARAYVPYQQYDMGYSPEVALERGTMFPELYMPYIIERY